MTKPSYLTKSLAVAAVALISLPGVPALAKTKAGTQVFQGLVEHVSTSNLKVTNPKTKETLGFLLVPHFGNVFKANGRTSAQVKDIAEGQYVKVYYDQKFLGSRHADRILLLDNANVAMKKLKS